MNQEEFSQLVAMLHDRYVEHNPEELSSRTVKKSGMKLVSEKEKSKLRMQLQDAVRQKEHEIRNRSPQNLNDP